MVLVVLSLELGAMLGLAKELLDLQNQLIDSQTIIYPTLPSHTYSTPTPGNVYNAFDTKFCFGFLTYPLNDT